MNKILPMGNISVAQVEDNNLSKEIDGFRKELFQYDETLLKGTNIRLSFDEFKYAPDGRFVIPYKNIDFDCLFKRNHESSRLYVFFSGARPENMPPRFSRWSYYKFVNGSTLNIDDPMCKLNRKLELGWYYGTETESYCDYIVEIVEVFAKQNGFKDIVFFSSSGGGYAALYCASKIDGSIAVAINPQINLNIHGYARTFEEITGLDLSKADKLGRNNLCELMTNANHSKFLLIENCESVVDMVQLNYLCSNLKSESVIHYGLSKLKKNIICWIYQAKGSRVHSAHTSQEYPAIIFGIEYLIDHFDDIALLNDFVLLLNELWFDRYVNNRLSDKHLALFLLMNQWVKIKQDGKNLASFFEKNGYKRIAIYGLSYIGERLIEELKDTRIDVKYGIDKNANNLCTSLDLYSLQDDLAEVDAVVVTPIFFFDEIKKELVRKLDCPIISLEDILYQV